MSIKAEVAGFESAAKDRPYFPSWGFASPIERHVSMLSLIAHIANEHGNGARPINVLEIGSWVGGSLLTWAHGIRAFNDGKGSILTVDPLEPFRNVDASEGAPPFARVMDQLLRSDLPYRTLRHNCRFAHISGGTAHFRASSREIGEHLRDKHFNIVYIDGEHGYAGVKRDLEIGVRVVADGGVLCGDDLEVQAHQLPAVMLASVRNSLDAVVPGTDTTFHPGVTAAISEQFGRVDAQLGFWNVRNKRGAFGSIRYKAVDVEPPAHIPERLVPYFRDHLSNMLAAPAPGPR